MFVILIELRIDESVVYYAFSQQEKKLKICQKIVSVFYAISFLNKVFFRHKINSKIKLNIFN